MFIQLFLFCIASVVTFYFPGRFLLSLLRISKKDTVLSCGFSWGGGIALFLLGTYAFSWVHSVYLYFLVIGISLIFESFPWLKEIKNSYSFSKAHIITGVVFLAGIISMVSLTWGSGMGINNTLVFYGVNSGDGVYHMSVIGQMLTHFPPIRPNLAGLPLRGYHFFYDFLVANIAILYKFSLLDLIYRFIPVLIAFFYGLSVLSLAKAMRLGKWATMLFIFLAFFSAESRFALFFALHVPLASYDSGIIQPLGNIYDPSVVISTSFLFLLGSFFVKPITKKESVLAGVFLGILPMLKIYAGILGFIGVVSIIGVTFFQKKSKEYIVILLVGIIVSGVTYGVFNIGSGGLVFAPLLLFRHFIEGSLAFTSYQWALKYQVYDLHHSIFRIAQLYIVAILLFFLPTLGIRFFGLAAMTKLFKKSWYSPDHIFWFSMSIAAIFLGSFFIQTVGVFNTIQFLWFLYLFLLIPATYGIRKLLSVKNIFLKSGVILIVLAFTIPDSMYLINQRNNSPMGIDANLITIATKIREVSSPKDAIMVMNRSGGNDEGHTSIYSALFQRPIYFETWLTEFNGADQEVDKRRKIVDLLSQEIAQCSGTKIQKILKESNTNYLFVHANYPCLDSLPELNIIAHSGVYYVYKIKK